MANEYVVFDSDAFTNERVASKFCSARACGGVLLNLNKTTDARLIPDHTAVKINEAEYLDGASQESIGSDAVKRFHAVLVVFRRPFSLLAAATSQVVPRCTQLAYFRKPKPT